MIRKLKRKFILLATVLMVLLMSLLVSIMNIINYSSVVSDTDAILNMLSNQQEMPGKPMPRGMSPEVPYESRYFTVSVSNSGVVQEADFSRIISVDKESVGSYVQKAVASKSERGFAGQFRFFKHSDGRMTHVIFLDCGRKLDSFHTFMWTSVAVGLLGCVVVFLVFLFAAGRIVRPIAESYRKQKRFITDAGHEIKTPLTIIGANLDLMESDFPDNESLSEIRSQTKRLVELTSDLVFLSKMEEAENVLAKIEFPVSDLANDVVAQFQSVAASQNKAYRVQVQPRLSMCGSPDAIRQLISILIDNALKYSPSGGIVTFDMIARKKTLSVSVFNTTGMPVSDEDISHLFERFYRADASRSSETGGHGIGLSIAQAITAAHQGKIVAENVNGPGFRITVNLPL